MSNLDKAASSQAFEGRMFLYDKPALLTKEDHGGLGLSQPERPYDFVRDVKGLPIVTSEVQTAQKFYPVIFSDIDNPVLLAIVGIIDDVNLFVDGTSLTFPCPNLTFAEWLFRIKSFPRFAIAQNRRQMRLPYRNCFFRSIVIS